MAKIILGAGERAQADWIATEKDVLDITSLESFSKYFEKDRADAFLAEHVWEHLTIPEGLLAARYCRAFLKPGGHLRLAVPDALNPNPDYIEAVRPGGSGPGASDHKVFYDHVMLRCLLTTAGFGRVVLLEWWDDDGYFHQKTWRSEDGHVVRSRNFDHRNDESSIRYTSLIVDAFSL